MLKYFWGGILLFATVVETAFSQELIYREAKQFSFYFEKKNADYTALFSLLENCPPDAFMKYYTEIEIEIFRQDSMYSIQLKSLTEKTECLCRYKNFLIGDFLFADKITIHSSVRGSGISIAEIDLKNNGISKNGVFFDTNFSSSLELSDFQFSIYSIEYQIDDKGLALFKQGLKRIDTYFLFDSLFDNWQQQFDLLDLSNVDMIPIYQFRLKDIEYEIKRYDSNEYELLLSRSGLDNQNYLQKRAILFRRIEDLKLELSQRVSVMDELMFEKAKQYEKEQNIEKAIFYYNRTLDYNPLHCNALERLSDLYTRQNLHKENLELFTNLRLRGEDVSCKSALTNSVCDSMCVKINSLIGQRNYYDAIKQLDTLELMLNQMAGNAYLQTYLSLRKQAQDGIYGSYIDVINRGIKGNKIDLCKEYIYGLVAVMENGKNLPSENQLFMQMMEQFIFRYKENVKTLLRRKKYEEVIRNNDAMRVFLDSIRYAKSEEFLDSYSISCSEMYVQKKKQSEEDAQIFFAIYGKYIHLSTDTTADKGEALSQELNDETRYESLVNQVFTKNISADDFSMLDPVIALLQWEKEKEYTASAIDSIFVEQKINPLIMNALSKINQYAWTNEFSSATVLMNKVEKVIFLLNLAKETSEVSVKYNQTAELLQHRINERAEQEFNTLSLKIRQLTQQKNYFQASHLLKTENVYLQKTVYQKQLNLLLQEVEPPAVFQEKMLSVEQSIALEDFTSAFIEYEEAYFYFLTNNISQYGLACDDLIAFIKSSKRESLLKEACNYYMSFANYTTAFDLMMYTTHLGYKIEDIQVKMGSAMRKLSYRFTDISQNHSFTKIHKPFLENFLGKFGYFWYTVKTLY